MISAPGGTPSLVTGCGLAGDGTEGTPLAVAVAEWPYDCPMDDAASQVYCDSTGALRAEPRPRATYVQDHVNVAVDAASVPAGTDVVVDTRTLTIVNPDPCRQAFVICEVEVDIDFDLPAGSGAAGGITTDEMQYFANTGTGVMSDVHCQVTKVYNRVIPAGGSLVEPLEITVGRGSGGATYNRLQSFMRAFIFNL